MKNESAGAKAQRIAAILDTFDREYGTDLSCALDYSDAWELLVATILSAQCTDKRVNQVTPALFRKYPDMEAFAAADIEELEDAVRSTGFYHMKAKHIKAAAKELLEHYGGTVPAEIDSLTSLPGVGRKTANVIRSHIYHIPSIVVDTHVRRISRLLNLTDTGDPVRAEFELMELLPEDHWILWNMDLITLGRTVCIAGRPRCGECFLAKLCPSAHNK